MDSSDLAGLYELDPPVVTAYLPMQPDVPDADARLDIAWKDLVRELAQRDVDAATIGAIEHARGSGPVDGTTRVIVASGGAVRLDETLAEPPVRARVTVGPLPHLLPLVEWRETRRAHVVVLADRAGANVLAFPARAERPTTELSAETADWPAHKTGVGGWAAKRYDASVEESWERSAKRVAELVERAASEVNPELVVASGDERALSLLTEQLPTRFRDRFVIVPGGGRHDDGSEPETWRRVAEAVAEQVAHDELELLGRFAEARGRGEGAVEGRARVVEALQRSQVATLLVSRGLPDQDGELHYGPAPGAIALQRADLEAMGVTAARTGPTVDVLMKAAIGGGAGVLVVSDDAPDAPAQGVGALLRFDLAAGGPSQVAS
jgi:hypothetical protein